jgi:hypothetical protein
MQHSLKARGEEILKQSDAGTEQKSKNAHT